MKNELDLWKKRRNDFWSTAIKYLRYLGNSGFMFTIYLLLLFGGYYYGQFLDWLPEAFPADLFFTIVFSSLLTRGRVRTFIKEGDLFYLTPREGKLAPYFKASLKYSWLMEIFWISFILLIFTPLFFDRINERASLLVAIFFLLCALKWWNLACGFEEQRIQDKLVYSAHLWIRFGLNLVVVYALFSLQPTWFIGLLIIGMGVFYFGYFSRLKKTNSLKWERLLEIENNTVMNFYRFANNFIDVPTLKGKVTRRFWLSPIHQLVKYKKEHVYHYLFIRAFTRANDYFGIYIRLTLLCLLFISIVQIDWGRYLIVALFSYMTALQLETLKQHYATNHLAEIYPVSVHAQLKSHQFWLYRLGLIQAVIISVGALVLHTVIDGLIVFFIAVIIYGIQGFVRLPKRYHNV